MRTRWEESTSVPSGRVVRLSCVVDAPDQDFFEVVCTACDTVEVFDELDDAEMRRNRHVVAHHADEQTARARGWEVSDGR